MAGDARDAIAKPTIAEALDEFLGEEEGRLSAKTYRQYRDVLDLLQSCLNGYGWDSLGTEEEKLIERLRKAPGGKGLEFCDVFGPEKIVENFDEFLGYFMVRKVVAGKDLLRTAGTVTKKLAAWLAAKGFIEAEDAEEGEARGAKAARDLPDAQEISDLLEHACDLSATEAEEKREGHFMVTKVEPGSLWFEDMAGRACGPIRVPPEVSARCRFGWTISGIIGRAGGRWHFIETWNVYPR